MVDCLHSERWIHKKRSTAPGRWAVRVGIGAIVYMAYITTYAPFYQANSPKANHTDSLDGAHLLWQCGQFTSFFFLSLTHISMLLYL